MRNVIPIMGEVGRFWVTSSSGEGRHLVDLLENQCGCPDYVCRRRAYELENRKPYHCRHLKLARFHFLEEILEHMREHALSK